MEHSLVELAEHDNSAADIMVHSMYIHRCTVAFILHTVVNCIPLIFFCPADPVPDWQPRILLGMKPVAPVAQRYIVNL